MRFNRTAQSAAETSTNSYADLTLFFGPDSTNPDTVFTNVNGAPISFHVYNTGASNLDFQVLASNDRTLAVGYWVDVSLSLTAVGTLSGKRGTIAQPGDAFYRVQIKSSAPDTPSTGGVVISQRGFE